jgi:hypothetical protein
MDSDGEIECILSSMGLVTGLFQGSRSLGGLPDSNYSVGAWDALSRWPNAMSCMLRGLEIQACRAQKTASRLAGDPSHLLGWSIRPPAVTVGSARDWAPDGVD